MTDVYRRSTWMSLEDWAVRPEKKLYLYCIQSPNLRNLYKLVFTKISPDEPFPFHNCGKQALSDVQVAHNLA